MVNANSEKYILIKKCTELLHDKPERITPEQMKNRKIKFVDSVAGDEIIFVSRKSKRNRTCIATIKNKFRFEIVFTVAIRNNPTMSERI